MTEKIAKWRQELQELSLQESPPIKQVNDVWRIIDRGKAWEDAGPRVFDEHLERFQSVAITVLGERDPKFELPKEDRTYAPIHGKQMKHSSVLRKGIAESLALLGSRPGALPSCSDGKPGLVARLVVRELLSPDDPVLWASLNDVLPLLSEADPGEFLENCESSLASESKPFEFLLEEEHSGVFGATYLSGLLWGLENLAWGPDYLARVALVLAGLAAIDPGGSSGNRSSSSLYTIFCPWCPQTCASAEKRVAAVKALQNDYPDVGWDLLSSLLPSAHQSSSGSHKPKWRELIPDNWSEKPTNVEYWEQVTAYSEIAVSLAKGNLAKLADLIPRIPNLPDPVRSAFLDYIVCKDVTELPDADRTKIWNALQELMTTHRKFADADWAMPPSAVADLESRADVLKPSSPVNEHKRLFTENDSTLMSDKGDYEAQRQELEERRRKALTEIHQFGGFDDIVGMVRSVESPWRLGFSFGSVPAISADSTILPELLSSTEPELAPFAGGYVLGRFHSEGWAWVDSLSQTEWPSYGKSKFYTLLPFCKNTWDRVAQTLGEDSAGYWRNAVGNIHEAEPDANLGIKLLIQHDRAHTAVRGLQRLQYQPKKVDAELSIKALEAALNTGEDLNRLDAHAVVELITALQKQEDVDQEELAALEWGYLPLLRPFSGGSPATLEFKLASTPEFFCEVIQLVFRARSEDPPTEEPPPETKSKAEKAYRLLDDWHTPPGTLPDGTFSGSALRSWVEKAKEITSKSGHVEVALERIGHVLVYSQKYAKELWLPDDVASVLNELDHEEMRRGLTLECLNSRGVHGFTLGREEREIATDYQTKAEEFELAGYPRLAVSLRELAESYERDAEREAKRNPYED